MAEIVDAFEAAKQDLVSKQEYETNPQDAYARARRAQAVGVPLDTEAPVGQPGFMGGVADIGRGLAKGTISTLPEQLGKAAEFFGAPEPGRRLQAFAKEQAEAYPGLKQSQVGQIAAAEDLSVRGGAYQAGEMTPLSTGPALAGAAAGAGIGLAGGPAGALAGAGIGYVVGSLASLPVFYGSQAQTSKEEIKKGLLAKGTPEAEAETQANVGAHLAGTVEAGGELVADIIPFRALFNPFVKAVKGQLVKSTLGGIGKKVAATATGIVGAEVATEMAQTALQDQIEKEYGSEGPGATWKSTLSVVVPTALMSIIPGGFTAAHTFKTNFQVKGALANPEADPEQRAAAAAMIFHSIKGEDPVAAHAFSVYAANQIGILNPETGKLEDADGNAFTPKPIELKDDAGYKTDLLGYLQDGGSIVDPLAPVPTLKERYRPPTPAEEMGIDETGGPTQAAAATAVNTGADVTVPIEQATSPEGMEAATEEADKATEEAKKAGEAAVKAQEDERKLAWSGLDRRLKIFGTEATAIAAKSKESAVEGQEPVVPKIHDALIAVSQQHWDPTAATRAMKTALDEKRIDVVHALVERAQRVAEEAGQATPSVPPDSGMYAPMQAALTKKAEAAQKVADKLAAMAKLQPEAGNAIQVAGAGGVLPHPPEGTGIAGGERGGMGQGIEGTPPAQTGQEGGGGIGGTGQPVGPGPVTGPSTPAPVGQAEDQQGHPPNGPGPQEGPGPQVTPGETTAGPPVSGPAPTPTPGQIEAGNYKKEHITAAGFQVSIENKEGMTRRSKPGVEPAWETVIQKADYGYIKRTKGNDGDQVDAFVKPGTAEDHDGPVFVIDQQKKEGGFDEHKVMLGYDTQLEAVSAYKANYPKGFAVGPVTQTTRDELKKWLGEGDPAKPFSKRGADPLDQLVDYDKLEETDDNLQPTGRYATGKIPARDALSDIESRLQFAKAMRDCLGV